MKIIGILVFVIAFSSSFLAFELSPSAISREQQTEEQLHSIAPGKFAVFYLNYERLYKIIMLKGPKTEDLALLQKIQLPFGLYLSNSDEVSDSTLKEISKLKNLSMLELSHTKITDVGLKYLEKMRSLKRVRLDKTAITDLGLKLLASISQLEEICVSETKITDEGIKELVGLENLSILDLDDTPITDSGLVHLAKLKNLEWLGLRRTKVTDEGLKKNSCPTKVELSCFDPDVGVI